VKKLIEDAKSMGLKKDWEIATWVSAGLAIDVEKAKELVKKYDMSLQQGFGDRNH